MHNSSVRIRSTRCLPPKDRQRPRGSSARCRRLTKRRGTGPSVVEPTHLGSAPERHPSIPGFRKWSSCGQTPSCIDRPVRSYADTAGSRRGARKRPGFLVLSASNSVRLGRWSHFFLRFRPKSRTESRCISRSLSVRSARLLEVSSQRVRSTIEDRPRICE